VEHLSDVAARCKKQKVCDEWLLRAALFHDAGKSTSYFQEYLRGQYVPETLKRHSFLSAVLMLASLGSSQDNDLLDLCTTYACVLGHHTGIKDVAAAFDSPSQSELETLIQQMAQLDIAGLNLWLESVELPPVACLTFDKRFWQPYRIWFSQYIASESSSCNRIEEYSRFQYVLRRFGLLVETDRDSAAGVAPDEGTGALRFTGDLLGSVRRSVVYNKSRLAQDREALYDLVTRQYEALKASDSGIWSLTAPTGSGKTLAALKWATQQRDSGDSLDSPIIYCLPFTSIIDQTAQLIRKMLKAAYGHLRPGMIAEHHHLAELGSISGEESLAHLWSEGWRADIICTTFVKLAEALFYATPANSRRFTRLTQATLILDEVQNIPVELWPVFQGALKSLATSFGTKILLVTATQPAIFTPEDNVNSIVFEPRSDTFNRFSLKADVTVPYSIQDLASRILDEISVSPGRSILVITNTIADALDLFYYLKDKLPNEYKLCHLSTNLRPKDRMHILSMIRAAARPMVVVSTQVVEAGIDISFDCVFRINAPVDSIVQAAGRCNRHGSSPRGSVFVVDLSGESGKIIYGSVNMDVARRVMSSIQGQTISEAQLSTLVHEYFVTLYKARSLKRAAAVDSAIRHLEFGALRNRAGGLKHVTLIEERYAAVPHFVILDDEDVEIWQRYLDALGARSKERLTQLRQVRPLLNRSIVEVPQHLSAGLPDGKTGLVLVPQAQAKALYDMKTGWRRWCSSSEVH
jgi:CRISPR-associated endonuclease/helicase Cas3